MEIFPKRYSWERAGWGGKKKKRQRRIHSYACACILITSHTAILEREVINGFVHQEFRKSWEGLQFFFFFFFYKLVF